MLVNDLVKLFDETPGILLSSEAAVDLADDVQAVVIRHMLASGNRAALETAESFKHAIEDIYVSPFGVTLYNLLTLLPFPGKCNMLPSARKATVEAMIAAMLKEQLQHIALATGEYMPLESHVWLQHFLSTQQPATALADFSEKGC